MSKKLNLEELKMATLVAMVNALGGNVTAKTFSQRSKAIERLSKLAAEQGVKLEDKFDLEGNERPPEPPQAPGEVPKKQDKAPAEKKEKGPSIRSVAEHLLLEVVALDEDKRKVGHSYQTILEKISTQFPGAKTSVACLRWYAVHMRERGVMPPTRPRAKPVAAPQAGE
jgi:hypothetical protein